MSQFSLVLRSAPLLETLILTGPFHLQKEDNYSYSPFSMDNMSQLHLSSIGESSELALARFLCSVEMPAIHHLRLSYMGQGFRAAMAFAPLVGRVVCLTMVADERFGQFADDFLLAFSWVEDVDLRLVGSQFFDALAANPDACDFLTALSLGPVDLSQLCQYMIAHPLDNLTLNHGLGVGDYMSLNDRELMRRIYALLPTTITVPSLKRYVD
jgi:hypothetical protein